LFVLHGTWFSGRGKISAKFGFWAEDTSVLSKIQLSKTKPKQHTEKREHPYQSSTEDVMDLLAGMSSRNFEDGQDAKGTQAFQQKPIIRLRTLKMPTMHMIPQPSQHGILQDEDVKGSTSPKTFQPWKIRHIELSASDALLWLAQLPEKQKEYSSKEMIGADIAFWSATAKFGLDLLARQRFLPSVVDLNKDLYAKWTPIFNDPRDAERLSLLCQVIPPVCVSEDTNKSMDPQERIKDFLTTALDEIIRMWLSEYLSSSTSLRNRLLSRDTLVSLWLNGLTSRHHTRIICSSNQKRVLEDSLTNWDVSIKQSEDSRGWRTCFRLEEPFEKAQSHEKRKKHPAKDPWQLTFHIQAHDDKSLMIPADEVWNNNASLVSFIGKDQTDVEDRFLEDLNQASQLYQPIGQSLISHLPTGCSIDIQQAYTFLKEGAWLLEECGYGVLVPSWWDYKKQQAQLGLKLKVRPPKGKSSEGKGFFSLDHLVDFQWEIAIGDDVIGQEEFERLAQLKTPLVNIRGKWVEINNEHVNAAMNFLDHAQEKGLTLADSLHIGLGYESVGLPVVGFDTEGWFDDFLKGGEQASFSERTVAHGFNGTLRPYQIRGFSWLSFLCDRGMGACLADDMGLGKTIELIALLLHDKDKGLHQKGSQTMRPVLLICPTSVVGNWKHELERFSPSLSVMIHHGSERHTGKGFVSEARRHDLVISTYALAYRDETVLKKIKWHGVVLDEAQNIKNPWTKQTQAIRGFCAGYRIALTGTPVENHLNELWSIMEFLNPGYLGSLKDFKKRFMIPIERYADKDTSGKLRQLIQPFMLRRLKTDKSIIQDLPEKLEMKVYYTLTREQATLYQATVNDMMHQIERSEGIQRRGLVLSTLLKLKQICNHPALFLQDGSTVDKRSGKLSRFMEMVEEVLATGDRALVFTQFVTMGTMLQDHLTSTFGREVLFLHGGVSRKKRDEMIKVFQLKDDGPSLFILSLKAGGFGLNLTSANHVFHFDRWWNPAVENQATDRAFRIGQHKNVQVHKFVCLGTLEEKIDQMLEHKKDLANSVLGSGETWLTELSNNQLKDLFALRLEEVENE
jgi:SNF2 family DNA or RNA helicase